MWGNALQPVMSLAHIHSSCRDDMRDVGCEALRWSANAAAPFDEPTSAWTPSTPARLRILLLKRFGLLTLTRSISCKMRFLPSHRQAPSLRFGTVRTNWASPTDSKTKLDLDDLLIARPGGHPPVTDLPLRTSSLFTFPVNREISESVAVVLPCPALDTL